MQIIIRKFSGFYATHVWNSYKKENDETNNTNNKIRKNYKLIIEPIMFVSDFLLNINREPIFLRLYISCIVPFIYIYVSSKINTSHDVYSRKAKTKTRNFPFSQESTSTNFNKIPSRDEKQKWSPPFPPNIPPPLRSFPYYTSENHSTINPVYFLLAETYLCPVALFPPSLTTVPISGEISAGRGGEEGRNKIACPLLALVLRNRSCVAHADVFPWYQADAFRQDLQGDGTWSASISSTGPEKVSPTRVHERQTVGGNVVGVGNDKTGTRGVLGGMFLKLTPLRSSAHPHH